MNPKSTDTLIAKFYWRGIHNSIGGEIDTEKYFQSEGGEIYCISSNTLITDDMVEFLYENEEREGSYIIETVKDIMHRRKQEYPATSECATTESSFDDCGDYFRNKELAAKLKKIRKRIDDK